MTINIYIYTHEGNLDAKGVRLRASIHSHALPDLLGPKLLMLRVS